MGLFNNAFKFLRNSNRVKVQVRTQLGRTFTKSIINNTIPRNGINSIFPLVTIPNKNAQFNYSFALQTIPVPNRANIKTPYSLRGIGSGIANSRIPILGLSSMIAAGSFMANSTVSFHERKENFFVSKYTTGPDNWSKGSNVNRLGTEGLSQALFNTRHGNSKQYRGF